MPKPTKNAARQNRRQARTQVREERRSARRPELSIEDKFTTPPIRRAEPLVALTGTQMDYEDAINRSRIIFGTGPAGTGKTYFAARMAAAALEKGEIKKIYLTRPAVEAGESLGFLPGELEEKYEPYLRPFKDALFDHFGQGHTEYLIRKKVIEPVPLGFLRGATIKDAWMLADEMQNATKSQMKMLLTRMGKGSKFILNGDPAQVDISPSSSGLQDAVDRLDDRDEIKVVRFTRADVVRDDIVSVVLQAYDN
jgi:phosphate starvation-inducible protein PhoH and related proteins